jgi:isochorismate synthase
MSPLAAPRGTAPLREYVARALTETDGKSLTAVIAVPVPFAPLSVFLRAVPRDMTVLWDPGASEQLAYATAGVAHRVDLRGRDRFTQMRAGIEAIWRRVQVLPHPDCVPPSPRIFGGLAFEPGLTRTPWEEFSDGCFVLPRWTYAREADAEHSVLCLAVNGDEDRGLLRREALMSELDDILEALEAYEGQTTTRTTLAFPRIPETSVRQLAFETWREHVERIRAAIAGGRFGKIVAARRCEVELPANTAIRGLDDIDVLTRLSTELECTRFAFRGATSTFLGASPEILIAKQGLEVTTQALAGTLGSLGSELPVLSRRSAELLTNKKDLAEHEFVVRQIRESLAPYCTAIDIAGSPQVSKIRSILHLNTPIVATLKRDIGAWDLLSTLHPTPAVGGFPKREAAEWIAANEVHPRGWYSGAVGWVDSTGDAKFVVAIRCGVLTPRRAFIFTGAGIVAGSDPAEEYSETELKQLPLLRALGVVV